MVYNGKNVIASARAVRALNKRANMVTPAQVREENIREEKRKSRRDREEKNEDLER